MDSQPTNAHVNNICILNNTYLHIPDLLSETEVHDIRFLFKSGAFDDGRLTAYSAAKEVKSNLQLNPQTQEHVAIQQNILAALNRNTLFRNAVLPHSIHPFVISNYKPGMHYGWHVDSPVMGNMIRTDVALTIFLNDPEEYDGGELELQTANGNILYKLNKGDAICYPCTQVHRVREVTRGERNVAVSWVQSLVKETVYRKMLFEIFQVTENLRSKALVEEEYLVLQQHYSNLLRMWAN
ncbi:Fe2+-dependent dioxygenase [Pedobacter alluvionis]|uniref:Fe2+-dependent dioxygenase n=1 Tax=Pedobacter alluvionis TaxID=475253 RepID=A0A497Y164_9SPHI|nr:Fe2+-dependent dioxygenase [Pedobacter alluvionis]RLJ76613.1 PKHD-type hydroxylase [Pedobacter alluvionis]TFB34107.1 Fe2+-dependent dioxygenase [Pedobacter alluvionis]